jgi:hypothetical protein
MARLGPQRKRFWPYRACHALQVAARRRRRNGSVQRGDQRLQEALGDRLPVQLDLAHRGALSREPWRAFGGVADTGSALPLADVIDTLVIEADGKLFIETAGSEMSKPAASPVATVRC